MPQDHQATKHLPDPARDDGIHDCMMDELAEHQNIYHYECKICGRTWTTDKTRYWAWCCGKRTAPLFSRNKHRKRST